MSQCIQFCSLWFKTRFWENALAEKEKNGIMDDTTNREKVANCFMINRENPEVTVFDPNADYTITVPGLPDNVNRGLSEANRRVAELGSQTKREAMELIELKTGLSKFNELGDFDSVGGERYLRFIARNPNGRFAFVHSHNTDGFLSATDMQTLASTEQIRVMISTSNDGLKRIACGNVKDYRLLETIYQKDVDILRERIKAGTLEMVDYPSELQKLLVNNAVRDFANLGFWETDGRI